LRRLQRRIAEGKFDNDNAALYFCNKNEEGYSDLQTLDLDDFGNIKNWPDNFFGDEMNEMFQMSEAIFERKKRAKQNGQ
jgi:predicted ATPase